MTDNETLLTPAIKTMTILAMTFISLQLSDVDLYLGIIAKLITITFTLIMFWVNRGKITKGWEDFKNKFL